MVSDGVSFNLREKFGLRLCAGLDGGGGLPTLFRSRALTEATEEDAEALRALGIEVVYDLRKEAERVANPEPATVRSAFEVRICPVDLQDDESRTQETKSCHVKAAYGRPGERMRFLYGVMADHADAVRSIVRSVIADGKPALVHCRRQTCTRLLRERKRPCWRGVRKRAACMRRFAQCRDGGLSSYQ